MGSNTPMTSDDAKVLAGVLAVLAAATDPERLPVNDTDATFLRMAINEAHGVLLRNTRQ